MNIATRMIDGELWLHDGSRKLTAEEIEAMAKTVWVSQAIYAWDQQASSAPDLGPLLTPVWNPATQQYEPWQRDGARRVPDEVMAYHRARILAADGGGGFVVGPT